MLGFTLLGLACAAAGNAAPPPDSAAVVLPDSTAKIPGVRDTVTVLPPVRVESTHPVAPGRSASTEVRLDRAAVIRFLPAAVGDALAPVPGVDLVKTGPWASRVSLRGLGGDRVLVMVDGVRLNSVRGHGAQTSSVALDRLDAVELLPGASSTIFGSDALGGVVNLVTHRNLLEDRTAARMTLSARAAEPGGSQVQSLRASVGGPRLGLELSGGLGHLDDLHTPDGPIPHSGDREEDFSARAAGRWKSGVVDYEHLHHAARDVGLPAFNNASGATGVYPLQGRDADRLELVMAGAGHWPDFHALAVTQSFRTDFTETTVDSVFFRGRFVGTKTQSAADRVHTTVRSIQPSLHLPGLADLRLISELRHEEARGPRSTDVTVRDFNGSITAQSLDLGESVPPAWRQAWGLGAFGADTLFGVRLEGGARYDDLHSHADSTATSSTSQLDTRDRRWSAEGGCSRTLGPITPYAHVASGFRAPNLDERYFNDDIHGGLRLFGNPDLRPEHSISYEAGVRGAAGSGEVIRGFRLSAYRADVEDLISFVYIGQLYLVPRFQYVNVRRARLEGLEGTLEFALRGVTIAVNGGLPRAIDRATGRRLADAGAARATFDLVIPIPRLLPQGTLSTRVRWNDAIKDIDPTLARPAFSTTSVEAACVVGGMRGVFAVRNLWNLSYREPLSFIPEPGRTFALALRYNFSIPLFGERAS